MSNTEGVLCFTGHRPNKLKGYDPISNIEMLKELERHIEFAIENEDVHTFISGMALGVDMWAARIVLKKKEKYPHIKLVCAIPCVDHNSKWIKSSVEEWNSIINRADTVHYVSKEAYTSYCMQKRNEWMVDNSEYVLAVWDGSKGETGNCINYAKKKGVRITHLNSKTLESSYIF